MVGIVDLNIEDFIYFWVTIEEDRVFGEGEELRLGTKDDDEFCICSIGWFEKD